jgi:heavy metal translocating P-type ATPase
LPRMDRSRSFCCDNIPMTAVSASHGDPTLTSDCRSMNSCIGGHKLHPSNIRGMHGHETSIKTDRNDYEKKQPGIRGILPSTAIYHQMAGPTRKDCRRPEVDSNRSIEGIMSISATPDIPEVTYDGSHSIAHDKIDVDVAIHGIEHISVRVQGMDCTGCEKKLHRSLVSLAELSNIKTSLLLAQAEFDLVPSNSINRNNIANAIEKMTGFICTMTANPGAELELIVENPSNLVDVIWPVGINNLAILSGNHVVVTYQPKVIGAREILSDQLFRYAKLATCSAPPQVVSGRAHFHKTCRMTLLSTLCTIPVLILTWAKLPKHEILYGAVSLGLATVIQIVVVGPFYVRALKALIFSRMVDMDLLTVLSSSAAYVYSVVAYAYLVVGEPLLTGEFFETSTLLVTLIMVGRTATDFTRHKAIESVSVRSLQNPTAVIIDPKSGTETEIDIRLLQYNDIFRVLPDSSVVTDGVVISGESEVDEAMVTGEGTLVPKKSGMSVVAGSVNHRGSLIIRVTHLPYENTIKVIGSMVDEVKLSKPDIQELADRVASYFAPTILGVALIVFVAWMIVGKVVRHQTVAVASLNAMTSSISVLIVSCPCAIGLAVPMVVVTASSVAAKHGLIFKTAETIDLARNISHVIFDKTGTLTQGQLSVTTEEYPTGNRHSIMSMVLGLALNSKHPISTAVVAHLESSGVPASAVCGLISISGSGLEALWNNSPVRAGNPHWLGVTDYPEVRRILHLGLSVFCVTLNHELVAIFGLQDMLRPAALETVMELKKRSIDIFILSGDNESAVSTVATQLSIPTTNTRARCSPEQKRAFVQSLLDLGYVHDHTNCSDSYSHSCAHNKFQAQRPIILFVGDGSNDAPSLAVASVGLHINTSTTPTLASSAADAVLLCPSLSKILTLIDLSSAFHKRVLFNFLWSATYNLIAVFLAAGVIPKARIPPSYAGLGEAVSIIPVLGVAVGLRFWRES